MKKEENKKIINEIDSFVNFLFKNYLFPMSDGNEFEREIDKLHDEWKRISSENNRRLEDE